MGGKSKVEELKKKSTVFPPVLCGSRVLFLSTCTLVGRLPLFEWEVMATQHGMKIANLLVCLRGSCSEPSSTQARLGNAPASTPDVLQGSALHHRLPQGPCKHPGF